MFKYFVSLSLLIIIFLSFGKIDSCLTNECTTQKIDTCLLCENFENIVKTETISINQPILFFYTNIFFEDHQNLIESDIKNSPFRPPIA